MEKNLGQPFLVSSKLADLRNKFFGSTRYSDLYFASDRTFSLGRNRSIHEVLKKVFFPGEKNGVFYVV